MISHALTIIANELNRHFAENYNNDLKPATIGNLSEGFADANSLSRERIYFSVVNIKEEKTLKNLPHRVKNTSSLKSVYENPPIFINLYILIASTYINYTNSLSMISRVIRFFQYNNVFNQNNVNQESITEAENHIDDADRLESFKLIFDLYSPTMEEINHLWGTLGGKQYPFVLYTLRMLDLEFKATKKEGGLITEIITNFTKKD
jgi:hypothetical protein